MGSYSAQIMVGNKGLYDDGIVPTHQLFLWENDRPAWNLLEICLEDQPPGIKIMWLPAPEEMLECALLMISLFILKDEDMEKQARSVINKELTDFVELQNDIDAEAKVALFEMNREKIRHYDIKIVINILSESALIKQLHTSQNYGIDVEILQPCSLDDLPPVL
jgi:hypothetical protein